MTRSPQVIVVGAGYAGLSAALHLADRRGAAHGAYDVAVVDRNPFHLNKIRLHEAALRDTDVTVPLADVLDEAGMAVHQAAVTGFDFDQGRVDTSIGPLRYDYLVLASGGVTNFFGIPGLAEYGFVLDSLVDAVRLRGHIQEQLVLGAGATDPAERDRRLRIVIGGAGYTGIELAGELAELLPRACAQLGLSPRVAQIVVVDVMPRILPVLDEESAAFAARELGRKGVQIRTGVKVVSCDGGGVTLDPGGLLPTTTMVWAGGNRASPVVADAGQETGRGSRLAVDAMLRVPAHPEVFAAGDCAMTLDPSTGQPVPATAQLGLQEGRHAADNVVRAIAGRELTPFRPQSRGEIVSLGDHKAVGWTKVLGERQVKLRGLIGGLAKRAAEAEWELHLWRETHDLDDIFEDFLK